MFQLRNKMLPKKKRITKDIFHKIMKNGKIFHSPFFVFYYYNSPTPQYSFVVPKKILNRAVKRNQYRRNGYNILRSLKNIKTGSGIFFFKKEALKVINSKLKNDIEILLKKIKKD